MGFAVTVAIEVKVSRGIRFFLVGLPDVAVKESQQRIEPAFRSPGYHWPGGDRSGKRSHAHR